MAGSIALIFSMDFSAVMMPKETLMLKLLSSERAPEAVFYLIITATPFKVNNLRT
jgi:hypothetical protein